MNLAQRLARTLTAHGADCLFGLMGDGNIFLIDNFARGPGQYVAAAHEAGAVLMAGGYAQTSGRVGFCTVTHGPGLTNTLTALVDTARAHTPVVLIAGDTSADQTANLQHIAQDAVARAAGAGFIDIIDPADSIALLGEAIALAQDRRGPVLLNVPARLWSDEVGDATHVEPVAQAAAPEIDAAALDRALGLISSSNRPLLLAGAGAQSPIAHKALIRLADCLDAPLATSLRGKGLFSDSPRDLGILGTLASDASLDVFANRDCVVAFGASLNPWTTYNGSLVADKRIIQVDIDATALGRFTAVDVGIVGDVAAVAAEMVRWLEAGESSKARRATVDNPIALPPPAGPVAAHDTDVPIDLEALLVRLNEVFPVDRTLVCDSGRHVGPALRLLDVHGPRTYVHTQAFGSIGLGMGYAIGAAFGRPAHRVLLTVGDGGFMLGGLTEFNTAVRYGLDILVVVLNDGAYGAEYEQFTQRALDPGVSIFQWPDLGPVAEALGGAGFTVRTHGDLEAVLPRILEYHGPVLLDVAIDPAEVPALTRAQ